MSNWRGKSLWSVSSRFTSAGLSFVLNVLLARAMSQDDLGLFFLTWSLAIGASLVGQWGASMLAVKWVASARARADDDGVRSAVWSLVFFTVLQSALIGLLLIVFLDRPLEIRLVLAGWTFALGLQTLLPELVRGFDDLKWASLLAGPVPNFLCLLALESARFGLGHLTFVQAAMFYIFSQLAACVVGLVLIAKRAPFSTKVASYRAFVRETTPIALSLAATYLLGQIDLWACSWYLTKQDVAVYGVAQRFNAFVSMPMMVLGAVMTPTIAALLASGERAQLNSVLRKGTFYTSTFALAVFCGGLALGWPVIHMLFGESYTGAYPLFLILGMGQVFHAMAGPNGYILLLSGHQRSAMIATLVSAGVLAALAWALGRVSGAGGIAAAGSLALAFQTIWMWLAVRKHLKLKAHFRLSGAPIDDRAREKTAA